MARRAIRQHRARKAPFGSDYDDVVRRAKRYFRCDEKFYVVKGCIAWGAYYIPDYYPQIQTARRKRGIWYGK